MERPFILIGVDVHSRDNEDIEFAYVKDLFDGYSVFVKKVRGCYNDKVSPSYLCTYANTEDMLHILEVARDHDQESVLHVDENREASLIVIEDSEEIEWLTSQSIGKFVKCSPVEALDNANWTADGSQFYICK